MRTASMILASCVLVVAACGDKPPATPAAPVAPVSTPAVAAPASGVFGWWEVPDDASGADIRGGAMFIAAAELSAVTKGGELFVRTCTTTVAGAQATIAGCGPVVTLTLDGDRLAFSNGFVAARPSPARAAELDQLLAAKRPPADICDRARACMRDAGPALSTTFNEDFELGGPTPDPTTCAQTRSAIAMTLGEQKLPAPASCQ